MKWNDVGLAACDSFGKDHSPGPKIEAWMKEAGFVDVHHEWYPLPIGPWPKDKHLVKAPGIFSSPRRGSFWIECGGANACLKENSRLVESRDAGRRIGGYDDAPLDAGPGVEAGRSAGPPCERPQGLSGSEASFSA